MTSKCSIKHSPELILGAPIYIYDWHTYTSIPHQNPYVPDRTKQILTFWQTSMCFLSPTIVFLVITLQVGQATSPFSLISRCHWSSGFAGEGEERGVTPSRRDHNLPGLLGRGQRCPKSWFAALKSTELGKVLDVNNKEILSQAQTMQALAALPAPHLLQLPEQTGSLGCFTWGYLTCWHFTGKRRFIFPTPLVSCTPGVKIQ